MTDRDLKKLHRDELLEILISQMKENDALQEELEEKEQIIEDLKNRLLDRQIKMDEAGSLARASMELSGIFDSAQQAAAIYLENIETMQNRMDAEREAILEDARRRSSRMLADAQTRSNSMLAETEARCEALRRKTDAYWKSLSGRLEEFYRTHPGLREMLEIMKK